MTEYTLTEMRALVTTMKDYIEDVLQFDKDVTVRFHLNEDGYVFNIDGDDKFQGKVDRYNRVCRLTLWETDADLDKVIKLTWEKLTSHMKRDERELRFGLTQLGNALEGDEFNTEIGKMIAARMREVRDDISAKYLPLYEKKVEEV
jgi:hypothetical protein